MATKNKTTETDVNVREYINAYVDNEQKKANSFKLVELMTKWSGFEPKMWGRTIADINIPILEKLCKMSIAHTRKQYG